MEFDTIAIQEVVMVYGGSQEIAQLVAESNRKGSKWDYSISYSTKYYYRIRV
jgi:deoxyribonuclease-1-like protein